jgi:hypothetical protein
LESRSQDLITQPTKPTYQRGEQPKFSIEYIEGLEKRSQNLTTYYGHQAYKNGGKSGDGR